MLLKGQEDIKLSNEQIVSILDDNFDQIKKNHERIEKYLKEKLDTDYEKIKSLWQDLLNKKITSMKFITKCSKKIGK